MKITPTNKDHIARLIAEKAYSLPAGGDNDILYNNMLRLSEALERLGEVGSPFRKLDDLRNAKLPPLGIGKGEAVVEVETTYFDVLAEAVKLTGAAA